MLSASGRPVGKGIRGALPTMPFNTWYCLETVIVVSLALFATSGCGQETGGESARVEASAGADGTRPADPEEGLARALHDRLQILADSGFTGAVNVSVGDTTVLLNGYGWTDSTRQYPITPATRFYVASVAKSFAGAAVMRCRELGLLALSDSIGRFFQDVEPDRRGITLHQLLTHTAGLGHRFAASGIADRNSAVHAILDGPLEFQPGSDFLYADDGYSLLAAVVEVATGQSYERFVERELFGPAGLTESGFWGEVDDLDRERYAQKLESVPTELRRPNWSRRGGGGIWTTVGDLYAWLQSLRQGRVLAASSVDLLMARHVELSSTDVGYGWFTSDGDWGTEIWTRGGESFGHNAVLRWWPDSGVIIVVASNAGHLRDGEEANRVVSTEIAEMVFSWRAKPPGISSRPASTSPSQGRT